MNILITGITGSGGSYLADYFRKNHKDINVHGVCRWHSTGKFDNVKHLGEEISIHECDLLDISSIIRTLNIVQPTHIYHLAAYANVRKCFDTPLSVVNNNIMGTANLLEAVRLTSLEPIIQVCSTSEVYGNPKTTPMTEEHALKPVNPYAVSKLAQESLAYAYFQSWGVKVIITRMFAYINPRRADLFATAFAHQVIRVERGLQDCIYHGNLNSVRTLIDVRDAMESYYIASHECELGEAYNIGGKTVISVGDFLKKLIEVSGKKIEIRADPNLLRPVDVTLQIPDTSKFDKVTGWLPKYTLEDSINFLLESLRKY